METDKRSTAGTCHPRGFGATATIQTSQNNVIFGICAVGADGLEGPAMLPFLSFLPSAGEHGLIIRTEKKEKVSIGPRMKEMGWGQKARLSVFEHASMRR